MVKVLSRATACAAAALLAATGALAQVDPPSGGFPDAMNPDACLGDSNVADGTVHFLALGAPVSKVVDQGADPVTYQWGKCVQCRTSAHCGINQWCGPSFTITSKWYASQYDSVSDQDKTALDNLYAEWSGVRWNAGQCYDYGSFNDAESEKINSVGCAIGSANGLNQKTDLMSDKAHCAFVYSWQPQKRTCTKSTNANAVDCPATGSDPDPYDNDGGYQTPGVCPNGSGEDFAGGNVPACAGGIGWTGQCVDNVCKVCMDGATASSKDGDLLCVKGTWAPKNPYLRDTTVRTVGSNVTAQFNIVIMFFLIWMWVVVCCTCLAAGRAAKAGKLNMQASQ